MSQKFVVLRDLLRAARAKKKQAVNTYNVTADTFLIDSECLHSQLHPVEAG